MKKTDSPYLFVAAVALMLTAAGNMTLWMVTAANNNGSFEATLNEYLSYFPEFIANAQLLTLVNIFLLALAGAFFYNSMKMARYRLAGTILGIITVLLLMWNVFSLL